MRWLVCVILLALTQQAAAGAVLERVRVGGGAAPFVRLQLSTPIDGAVVKTLPADGDRPARVYVDLPATVLGPGATVIAGTGDLLRVRTGQFDAGTVRVVLDLATPTPHALYAQGRTITVTLAAPLPPPAPPPSASAPPAPLPPPAPRAADPLAAPRERPPTIAPGTIVVDAGHGGYDPGATGPDGVFEKQIALDVARRVADRLARRVTNAVVLTRTDDSFVTIDERLARAPEAAAFVSLHANAAEDVTLSGIEIYFGGGEIEPIAAGEGPAARFGREMMTALRRRFPATRKTVHPGGFAVLTRNPVPSLLVEVGYLTNPGDASRLRDVNHRALVADAVADGVIAFLRDRANAGLAKR